MAFPRSLAQRLMAATALSMMLPACGSGGWFGSDEAPPLPGPRVSVLQLAGSVTPDPRLSDLAVTLPSATVNSLWPQPGGYPDHVMGHLAVSGSLKEAWRADIGAGSGRDRRILSSPVVAEGRVFAMDAEANVTALDEQTGRQVWRVDLTPEDEDHGTLGGGVAFGENRLYASTGYGEVIAIDPASGAIQWRKRVAGPVRGGPTVANGRVFVVTVANQLVALSAGDGTNLWSHSGILETAGILGSASPAADANVVIAPYSSGELFALRAENGRVAWSDTLAAIRRVDALSSLADIRGLPVMDRGLVIAVSHSGRMVAIDERSGARAWEQDVGGTQTPWVAGDFVFVLSNDNQVMALTRNAGRVRWVTPLDRYEDPDSRSDPIVWAGPVLGGGRLWLVSNNGRMVGLSPDSGAITDRRELPDGTELTPVIANNALYVLTSGGTLVAYR